jgi:hypothetical protein
MCKVMLQVRRYEGKVNMTIKDTVDADISGVNLEKLNENLRRVEALSERLTKVMTNKASHQSSLDAPDNELFKQEQHIGLKRPEIQGRL